MNQPFFKKEINLIYLNMNIIPVPQMVDICITIKLFTSSLMTVALLRECKAEVIFRPRSAKTILENLFLI